MADNDLSAPSSKDVALAEFWRLRSFKGYAKKYYPIPAKVFAEAGLTWFEAVDLVGCKHCDIRLQWRPDPNQAKADDEVLEELFNLHLDAANLAKCSWARRVEGSHDSELVKTAIEEYESLPDRHEDDDDWKATGVLRSELQRLRGVQIRLGAIVKQFVERSSSDSRVSTHASACRDLKATYDELEKVVDDCTSHCDLGNFWGSRLV